VPTELLLMLAETLFEFHVAGAIVEPGPEPICKNTLGAPEPIVAPAASVTSTVVAAL
jgi:hypothetical protein